MTILDLSRKDPSLEHLTPPLSPQPLAKEELAPPPIEPTTPPIVDSSPIEIQDAPAAAKAHKFAITELSRIGIEARGKTQLCEQLREWRNKCYSMLGSVDKDRAGKKVVKNLRRLCKIVSHTLKHKTPQTNDSIFLCTDAESTKLQGVAVVSRTRNFIVIKDIITNPDNVQGPINKSAAEKIRGAGTAIVAEVGRRCLSEGKKAVYLISVDTAIPFYTKCGFQALDRAEADLPSMILSAQKLNSSEISQTLFPRGASLTPLLLEHKDATASASPPATLQAPSKGLASSYIPHKRKAAPKKNQAFKIEDVEGGKVKPFVPLLNNWEDRCHTILGDRRVDDKEKDVIRVVKKSCKTAFGYVDDFKPSTDLLLVCKDPKTSEIQGMCIASQHNNTLTIHKLVINPDLISSLRGSTYAEKLINIGEAIISELAKKAEPTQMDWMYARAKGDEQLFYESLGFEFVDSDRSEEARLVLPLGGQSWL
jgi:N-acetylglutamate synthase-like GNAT family acetyltransferase